MADGRTHYTTHDNGGRKYLVVADVLCDGTQTVTVYTHDEDDDYTKGCADVSRANYISKYSASQIFADNGSSILLKKNSEHNHEYVFIGHTIIEFATTDEITTFHSDIGPNDVVYPYSVSVAISGATRAAAAGAAGPPTYIYRLMIEGVKITTDRELSDPYRFFYENRVVLNDPHFVECGLHKKHVTLDFANSRYAACVISGSASSTSTAGSAYLWYQPRKPDLGYEWMTTEHDDDGKLVHKFIHCVREDGTTTHINRGAYNEIMQRFAAHNGFSPLEVV